HPDLARDLAATGDLEILLAVKPPDHLLGGVGHGATGGTDATDGAPALDPLELLVGLQAPAARGSITLASADPLAPPRIEYRYLKSADERARLRIGIRTAVALLQSDAFSALFDGLTDLSDATLADDAQLDAWVHAHL